MKQLGQIGIMENKKTEKFKIVFRNLSQEQLNQTYKLHKEKLGEDYLDFNHFKKLAKDKKLLIAVERNVVVGYLTIDFLTEREFFKTKKINLTASDNNVVVFNTCAVKYEKRSIGSFLFQFAIENFAKDKVIYCPVWKSGENINAHNLLTKFGFRSLITLEKFWYNESLAHKNYCPVCGSPCKCDNVIYKKDIE